jgi:hypothetical protein
VPFARLDRQSEEGLGHTQLCGLGGFNFDIDRAVWGRFDQVDVIDRLGEPGGLDFDGARAVWGRLDEAHVIDRPCWLGGLEFDDDRSVRDLLDPLHVIDRLCGQDGFGSGCRVSGAAFGPLCQIAFRIKDAATDLVVFRSRAIGAVLFERSDRQSGKARGRGRAQHCGPTLRPTTVEVNIMDLTTLITACALTVDPKIMHALIWHQSGGAGMQPMSPDTAPAPPPSARPDDVERARQSPLFPVMSRPSERSPNDHPASDRPATGEQKIDAPSVRLTVTQPHTDGLFVLRSGQRSPPGSE